MSSDSLPLKYRPMVFADLVGQEVIAKYLSSLAKKRQAKNIITYGSFGTGKTTSSRIYARALNCQHQHEDGSPCNECDNCKASIEGRYSDYLELDAASQSSIENIKRIHDVAKVPPMHGKFRIILIDEAQALSNKAWDVLLKIIEEPPPYLCFLFSTTEKEKIRPAIVSRCQELEVKTLSNQQAVAHLKKICEAEGLEYEENALNLIAFVSKGHPRSLLKNLEQCSLFDSITSECVSKVLNLGYVAELMRFIRGWQNADIVQMKHGVDAWGSNPKEFIKTLQEFLVYVVYHSMRQTQITINPVFSSIPNEEIQAFHHWLMSKVSPTIDGGVPKAIMDVCQHLNSQNVESRIGLDIVLYSLIQLAEEHSFRINQWGKAPEQAMHQTQAQTNKFTHQRGRRFSKVTVDAVKQQGQEGAKTASQEVLQQNTAQPTLHAQKQQEGVTMPVKEEKLYAHNLDDFGFSSQSSASTIVTL